jgi:predicted RNA binding protein YcfA (HicA-like mRNA interferase family)
VASFPAVNGKTTIRVLQKLGFRLDRIEGSHHIMVKDGHPWTVPVPVHGSRTLPRGTLASILRMAGVSSKRFLENL